MMPYIVLILGLLIGLFALYRFFIKASTAQIRAFFRGCIIAVYIMILLFFAVTGRIIISLGLLLLAIPFIISYFRNKMKSSKGNSDNSD